MKSFYEYQQHALQPLKQWGLGSMLVGSLALPVPHPVIRQMGIQCLTWGGIDAGLALLGERQARHKATQLADGALDEQQVARDIRQLHRILMLNTGLDVVYILAALGLIATSTDRPQRLGVGIGVLVQGGFLLVYDALFAHDIGRNWPHEVASI